MAGTPAADDGGWRRESAKRRGCFYKHRDGDSRLLGHSAPGGTRALHMNPFPLLMSGEVKTSSVVRRVEDGSWKREGRSEKVETRSSNRRRSQAHRGEH